MNITLPQEFSLTIKLQDHQVVLTYITKLIDIKKITQS